MAALVKIEETVELPHPRAAVWPILSRTDWINRAIGLPPVKYEIQPVPEGGTRVIARARLAGVALTWQEFPFEWIEPKSYQVRRVFLSGPLTEGVMGLRLRDTSGGCAIEIFAHFTPRNVLGRLIARHVLGPKTMRDMRALVRHVSAHLSGRQSRVMPKLPTAAANPTTLALGLQRLRADHFPEPVVARLNTLLTEQPDVELSHLRPFAVARRWQADRWETLRLFLHATRAGLFNLSWEVLCPNCRSTRLPRTSSLRQLSRVAHCDVCNIKYDAEFDKSVELKFSVHPAVRPCDEQTFCLVGPGGKPHIVSQLYVEPGQQRDWDVPELTPDLRLRSLQVKASTPLPAADMEVVCHPERFELRVSPTRSKHPKVRVANPNAFPVLLALEQHDWDDEILTASRVTNWQEFRDLFATEVISPTEQITVGAQVVVFTDLRGSTAMYNRIGDAPAYALVRDHFKIMHDVVAAHHGTVVKTIGDAVMAVFSDLPEALAAVRQMHTQLAGIKSRTGEKLELKSALHTGSCLAVNANERLDFFGSTINLAARLVEHGRGGDLIITDETYWRDETRKFLGTAGDPGVSEEEHFTGAPAAVKFWRIPMG